MKYIFKSYQCTHCFGSFKWYESPFRCISPNPICKVAETQQLLFPKQLTVPKKLNFLQPILTFFQKWYSCTTLSCKTCHQITSQHLCPLCHRDLDQYFLETHQKLILCLVPTIDDGQKYVENLLNSLRETGLKNWILQPQLSDQPIVSEINTTDKENKNFFYMKNILLKSLKVNSEGPNQSYLKLSQFNFSFVYKILNFNKSVSKYLRIQLIVCPGSLAPNLKNLFSSMPIIKDFPQFHGLISLIYPSSPLTSAPTLSLQSGKDLQNLFLNLSKNLSKSFMKKCPVAVVQDDLENYVPIINKNHVFLKEGNHLLSGYDENDGKLISSEVESISYASYGVNYINFIKNYFKIHRFFIISSSSGYNEEKSSINGRRLQDPFLWILSKCT